MKKGWRIFIRIIGSIILYFISLIFIGIPLSSYLHRPLLDQFETNLCANCPFPYSSSSLDIVSGPPTSCTCMSLIVNLLRSVIIPGLLIILFNKLVFNDKKK